MKCWIMLQSKKSRKTVNINEGVTYQKTKRELFGSGLIGNQWGHGTLCY